MPPQSLVFHPSHLANKELNISKQVVYVVSLELFSVICDL